MPKLAHCFVWHVETQDLLPRYVDARVFAKNGGLNLDFGDGNPEINLGFDSPSLLHV